MGACMTPESGGYVRVLRQDGDIRYAEIPQTGIPGFLRGLVGGAITVVPLPDDMVLLANWERNAAGAAEGKRNAQATRLTGQHVVGDAVVCPRELLGER